jgi:Protein of unknown function (DUF2867)
VSKATSARSRLPNSAHEAHPWVIAQVAPDFELLDVWGLPAGGRADEFATLVAIVTSLDPTNGDSRATRALFSLRFRLGAWFGWDDAPSKLPVPGRAETTLSARVPEQLRDTVTRPIVVGSTRFVPIYKTEDEWAAEISNSTVHAVMHLAWVEQGEGIYRGQMGVYVKPRGRFGATYMALIGPFRHLIVYPALMRQIARAWEARPRADSPADERPA